MFIVFDPMEFIEFIRTPKVDSVKFHRRNSPVVEGTLCVTGHHLILSSRQDHNEELWLLHRNVDSIEKRLQAGGGVLTLRTKDFEHLQLEIPSAEQCLNIAVSIEQLRNVEDETLWYPFFYRPLFTLMEDGWHAYRPETEFSRLKVCTDRWRLSNVNKNFQVCSSYAEVVVVPKEIDDATLQQVALFRQNGRFPVLSYFHKENSMVILRSSQPLTGPNGKRCREDERLVNAVLGIGRRGYIVDTRSTTVAKLATAKGGGVEPDAHYSQWRRIHQPIESYKNLQDSLVKMIEACQSAGGGGGGSGSGSGSMDKWLSKLDGSGWLGHVKDVITCACVAAQCIDKEGACVLVHGTRGTDASLQVTSLAQLILDPDCRTITGLQALVEREWLQAGHPFAARTPHSAFAATKDDNQAPTFLLFLDCVWQIWQQFPCSFEFNESFLLLLQKHSYASQFGTFLCNDIQGRTELQLTTKTVSLWSYVNRPEVLTVYLNPLYEPNAAAIWPSVAPQSLQLWLGLYERWQRPLAAQQQIWNQIRDINNEDKELKSKVIKLRKQLATLEKEAINAGLIPMPTAEEVAAAAATY